MIEIIVYDVFSVADTVSKADGGTFDGNVTMAGTFTSKGIDDNADANAITIDSSERVLVNKTSTNFGVEGVELGGADGKIFITRDNNSLYLNRLSSDGDIVQFYKDSTQVGSIGVADSGDRIYLANGGAEGIGIDNGSNAFVPTNASGAYADNHISLGRSDARWAGIYTSDGLFVGGTGSANQLDDYEEGTWTPSLSGATSGTRPADSGHKSTYTKVGNMVHVTTSFGVGGLSGTASGKCRIEGLPFNYNGSNSAAVSSLFCSEVNLSSSFLSVHIGNASSGTSNQFFPFAMRDDTSSSEIDFSSFDGDSAISFSISYQVA